MKVTIIGPLGDGSMHIHRAGCADIARERKYYGHREHAWEIDATSEQYVVEAVWSDHIDEKARDAEWMKVNPKRAWGDRPEQPYTAEEIAETELWATWEPYHTDMRFFPCCGELPYAEPTEA